MNRFPRRDRRRGNAMVEFALCLVFLAPLMLGTFNLGMNLARNLQVTQLARNAGHMYVRWVDFSIPESQQLIVRLADGLNMTRTGGDGTVILSQVLVPAAADCTGAGLNAGACTNLNIPVIVHRIQFGNSSLKNSAFGSPDPSLIRGDGSIAVADYLTDSRVRATGWSSVMTLASGEIAYVSEVYVKTPAYNIGDQGGVEGVYARSIF